MGLLRLLVVLSAVLALTGAVPAIRRRRWHAFWPAPIMAFAIAVGLRDLIALMGGPSVGLSTSSLVLGVWAGVVAVIAGAMEMAVGWRGAVPERAFVAPALLVAGGIALCAPLLAMREDGSLQLAGVLSGLLIIASGALLAAGRLWPTHQGIVRYAWPVALGLGAVSGIAPARPLPDRFAEAKAEIASLEAAWHQRGLRVARTDSGALGGGIALIVRYRVEASDVYVYVIAHDTLSMPDWHLEPRLALPPSSHGVPHLHRSSHLLVVCITTDWRFAQQLDELVRALAGREAAPGRRAVARGPSMSRLGSVWILTIVSHANRRRNERTPVVEGEKSD
jgi:hypothetical protein